MKTIVSKLSYVFPIVSLAILLQYCAPGSTANSSNAQYEEDLSSYRPAYAMVETESSDTDLTSTAGGTPKAYVAATNDIKAELDTVINRIIASRKDIQYIDGYTIQLYSGNNRDKANQVKSKTYELLEDQRIRMSYDQPNYKIRVGEYPTRLEANADFVLLRGHFSRAVLVPTQIKIAE